MIDAKSELIDWIKSHKISNKKIYLVFGMKRSGNHAIIHWLCDSISGGAVRNNICSNVEIYGNVGFINNFTKFKSFTIDEEFYKYILKSNILVISFEDENIFNLNNMNGNAVDNIVIIRNIKHVVASRLQKGSTFENENKNKFKCNSLFFEKWLNHANNCSNTSFCVKYDSWLVSRDYRDKVMNSIGYLNLDSTNYVSHFGHGSSFVGIKLDDTNNLLNRDKQVKIPANIQKNIDRGDIKKANNYLFNNN